MAGIVNMLRSSVLGKNGVDALMTADVAGTQAAANQQKDADQVVADQASVLLEKDENLLTVDGLASGEDPSQVDPGVALMANAFLNRQGTSGDLRPTDDYPMLQRPIQAGVYQGSVIGSVPIFSAAGGRIPHGVIRDRQAALQQMAAQQAKMKERVYQVALTAGPALHNERLNEMGFEMIEEMLGKYGSWNAILGNDKAKLDLDKNVVLHRAKVNAMNFIQSNIEKLLDPETISNRNIYIPSDVLRIAEEFNRTPTEQLYGNPQKLSKMNDLLQSYSSVQSAIESAKEKKLLQPDEIYSEAGRIMDAAATDPEMAEKISEAMVTLKNNNDYALFAYNLVKAVSPERVAGIANLISQSGTFHPSHDEEYIARAVMNSSEFANEMKTVLAEKYNVEGRKNLHDYGGSKPQQSFGVVSTADYQLFEKPGQLNAPVKAAIQGNENQAKMLQQLTAASGLSWVYDGASSSFSAELNLNPSDRNAFEASGGSLAGSDGLIEDETGKLVSLNTYLREAERDEKTLRSKLGPEMTQSVVDAYNEQVEEWQKNMDADAWRDFMDGKSGDFTPDQLQYLRVYDKTTRSKGDPKNIMFGQWQLATAKVQMARKRVDPDGNTTYIPITPSALQSIRKAGTFEDIHFVTAIEYIALEDQVQPGIDKEKPAEGARTITGPSRSNTRVIKYVPLGTEGRTSAFNADNALSPSVSTGSARRKIVAEIE